MNFIQSSLEQLNEMSHKFFADMVSKKCTCGKGKSLNAAEHKRACPCRKTLSFFGEGLVTEGMMKKALEAKVEKLCKCDGGASLDPEDHEDGCPVKKLLNDPGSDSDIDKADYEGADR
jgi:hypothetical protein